jgi:hypothetical protein
LPCVDAGAVQFDALAGSDEMICQVGAAAAANGRAASRAAMIGKRIYGPSSFLWIPMLGNVISASFEKS